MAPHSTDIDWDLDISPKSRPFDFRFGELIRYRDLLFILVRRDFVAQYQQTILGPAWHLFQPLLTTLMLLLVFRNLAGIPTDSIDPPILFYFSGIILWTYFATCFTNSANTFVSNAPLFGKVYFPRLVMPLSNIVSNVVRFGVQLALLVGLMIWFSTTGHPLDIHWQIVFLPLYLAIAGIMALGVGLIASAVTTKYRDFANLTVFVIQLAMYVTPVAYPLSFAAQKRAGWIVVANPLSPVFEAFRFSLFGHGGFSASGLLWSGGVAIVSLAFGTVMFNAFEKTFIDTV